MKPKKSIPKDTESFSNAVSPPPEPDPHVSLSTNIYTFVAYESLSRKVKSLKTLADLSVALRHVCDNILEMFSPEQTPDAGDVTRNILVLLPPVTVIFTPDSFSPWISP